MHNRLRLPLLAALFASLVAGSGMHAAVSGIAEKIALSEQLEEQISRAGRSYRTRQQIAGRYERAETRLLVLQGEREGLLAYQQALRDERDALRAIVRDLEDRGATADGATRSAVRLRQATVVALARDLRRKALTGGPLTQTLTAGRTMADERTLTHIARSTDIAQGAMSAFAALAETEARLRASHAELVALQDAMEATKDEIALSEEGLTSVRAITRDVHDQVLLLQRALARIDAQLRSRAERALIAKGLLSASPEERHAAPPDILWPVEGPVSAGFQNAAYLAHFGVPHLGVDIVVPQGSSVRAAAEGIVFLVRDGGEKGYSYVLIGHKDGLATLYGHLSSFSVAAGQRVAVGQEIGRSGGTPGTVGAGPMTTAAHLHFELIQQGKNVDPLDVLPAR